MTGDTKPAAIACALRIFPGAVGISGLMSLVRLIKLTHHMSVAVVPEEPAPDPFGVECIVAAIGIKPFLDKSLQRVHGYHVERAGKVKAEIARKLYRFVQRSEPEDTAELPDFDYDEVAGILTDERLPEHVQQQIAAFGEHGETALACQVQVTRIAAFLTSKLPRRVHMSLMGPLYTRPPEIDIARFARLWSVACDPMIVLDDLNEYAVSRDMVQALADVYPLISAELLPAMQDALVRAKTVDPKFALYRQKETLLRVLTKQEQPNVALGQAIQAARAKAKAAMKPTAPAGTEKKQDEGAGSESTAAQKIDAA